MTAIIAGESISQIISDTKEIEIKINDFLKFMDDKEKKRKLIASNTFTVGAARLNIRVTPSDFKSPDYIGVYVGNLTDEDQVISAKFKHDSKRSWKMISTEAHAGFGASNFMSHEKYKTWANINGDIFKLEVSVTVHSKDSPEVPTSLRPEYLMTSVTLPIMMDEDTADFSLRCNTKTFRVHKNFLCNR